MALNDTSNPYDVRKQFELDAGAENYSELVEENKKSCEAEAVSVIDARMGATLADYITLPVWTVENSQQAGHLIYSLTMRVLFKP